MKKKVSKLMILVVLLAVIIGAMSGISVMSSTANAFDWAYICNVKADGYIVQTSKKQLSLTKGSEGSFDVTIKEYYDVEITCVTQDGVAIDYTFEDGVFKLKMTDEGDSIFITFTPIAKPADGIFGKRITSEINALAKIFYMAPYELEQYLLEFANSDVKESDNFTSIFMGDGNDGGMFEALGAFKDADCLISLGLLSLEYDVKTIDSKTIIGNVTKRDFTECMLNSDIIFKGLARIIEAFQTNKESEILYAFMKDYPCFVDEFNKGFGEETDELEGYEKKDSGYVLLHKDLNESKKAVEEGKDVESYTALNSVLSFTKLLLSFATDAEVSDAYIVSEIMTLNDEIKSGKYNNPNSFDVYTFAVSINEEGQAAYNMEEGPEKDAAMLRFVTRCDIVMSIMYNITEYHDLVVSKEELIDTFKGFLNSDVFYKCLAKMVPSTEIERSLGKMIEKLMPTFDFAQGDPTIYASGEYVAVCKEAAKISGDCMFNIVSEPIYYLASLCPQLNVDLAVIDALVLGSGIDYDVVIPYRINNLQYADNQEYTVSANWYTSEDGDELTDAPANVTSTVNDEEGVITVSYSGLTGELRAYVTFAASLTVNGKPFVLETEVYNVRAKEKTAQSGSFAKDSIEVTYGDDDFTNEFNVEVIDEEYGVVAYYSSNEDVVVVDEDGNVSIVGAGTATIKAIIMETYDYLYCLDTYTVTVAKKIAITTIGTPFARFINDSLNGLIDACTKGSDDVEIKAVTDSSAIDGADLTAIQEAVGSNIQVFNAKLYTVIDGVSTDISATNEELVGINYLFDANGKDNIRVARAIDGVVTILTETPNEDGEYIVVNKDNGSITIYSKKYATFAIAYDTPSNDSTLLIITICLANIVVALVCAIIVLAVKSKKKQQE